MQVKHDVHTHTLHSSCCFDPEATVRAYVDKAKDMGHTVFGFSDHMWDDTVPGASEWYKGQWTEYVLEMRDSVPRDTGGLKILIGAESEYCAAGDILGVRAETAKKFDYMLIPHTHTHMRNFTMPEPREITSAREGYAKKMREAFPELTAAQIGRICSRLKHDDLYPAVKDTFDFAGYVAKFILDSFETMLSNPEFARLAEAVPTIIAHPLSPGETWAVAVESQKRIDFDRLRPLLKKAAGMNVAFDVNMCIYRLPDNGYADDPMVRIMRAAREEGIKFACGSDAHSVRALSDIKKAGEICAAIGIEEKDLMDLIRK